MHGLLLGRADLCLPQCYGALEAQAAGRELPKSAEGLWAIFPAFRLPSDLDGERPLYLRVTSRAPPALAVSVQAMPLFFEQERHAHQRRGVAGGVLAVLRPPKPTAHFTDLRGQVRFPPIVNALRWYNEARCRLTQPLATEL